MKYTTTKETVTLPKKTPMDFPEECYDERFTHIVTSVRYISIKIKYYDEDLLLR